MMKRKWLSRVVLSTGLVALTAASASAQQVFQVSRGDSRNAIGFTIGGFFLRGEDSRPDNDVLIRDLDELAFQVKDFNNVTFGGDTITFTDIMLLTENSIDILVDLVVHENVTFEGIVTFPHMEINFTTFDVHIDTHFFENVIFEVDVEVHGDFIVQNVIEITTTDITIHVPTTFEQDVTFEFNVTVQPCCL